MALSERV